MLLRTNFNFSRTSGHSTLISMATNGFYEEAIQEIFSVYLGSLASWVCIA
jgi:hypothetical protein